MQGTGKWVYSRTSSVGVNDSMDASLASVAKLLCEVENTTQILLLRTCSNQGFPMDAKIEAVQIVETLSVRCLISKGRSMYSSRNGRRFFALD